MLSGCVWDSSSILSLHQWCQWGRDWGRCSNITCSAPSRRLQKRGETNHTVAGSAVYQLIILKGQKNILKQTSYLQSSLKIKKNIQYWYCCLPSSHFTAPALNLSKDHLIIDVPPVSWGLVHYMITVLCDQWLTRKCSGYIECNLAEWEVGFN